MRIVVLTDKAERHYYFANQICKTGQVVGVFTGAKHSSASRSLFSRVSREFRSVERAAKFLVKRFYDWKYKSCLKDLAQEQKAAEAKYFRGSRELFRAKYANLEFVVERKLGSVNSDFYIDKISSLTPDIVVVMGTCLIGKKLINSVPLMLNLHTGLSPFYRGGNTNLWPIIYNDPGYFGVTIHHMRSTIDGGEIVYQGIPKITVDDNFSTMNAKAIIIGSELLRQAIVDFAEGRLTQKPQTFSGKLFHNADMNGLIFYRYFSKKIDFFKKYGQGGVAYPAGLMLNRLVQESIVEALHPDQISME